MLYDHDISGISYISPDDYEGEVRMEICHASLHFLVTYDVDKADKYEVILGGLLDNLDYTKIEPLEVYDKNGVTLSTAIANAQKRMMEKIIERNDYEEGEPDDWRDKTAYA